MAESLLRIEKVRPPLSAVGKKHRRLAAVIGKECSRDFDLLNTGGTAEIFTLRPERFYVFRGGVYFVGGKK